MLIIYSTRRYQSQLVRQIRRGYDGSGEDGAKLRWTIPAALMYCITIYTTIGTLKTKCKVY